MNNIIIIVVCASVFLGTIYPLIIEALTGNKISVGEPYYNATAVPIMIPAIIIMGIGPILSWGSTGVLKTIKKIFPTILLTLIGTIIFFIFYKTYSLIGVIGIILAFWIISNNITALFDKKTKILNGMIVAHLGIGFLILGITGSSVWQKEKIIKMKIGSTVQIENYNITFKKISEIKKANYVAIQGNFIARDNNKKFITELNPENRFYLIKQNFTTEASIHTNLIRDLYIVLGSGDKDNGWIVRIYVNPLVMWIWIGTIAIFLGGIITMNNKIKKLKFL